MQAFCREEVSSHSHMLQGYAHPCAACRRWLDINQGVGISAWLSIHFLALQNCGHHSTQSVGSSRSYQGSSGWLNGTLLPTALTSTNGAFNVSISLILSQPAFLSRRNGLGSGTILNEMLSASSVGLCWSALGLLLGSRGLTLRQTNNSSTNGTDCVGINAISPKCSSNETPYYRDIFYVGGHYENSDLGNLTYDQIYVEKLTPVGGTSQPRPMIFFHGGGMYPINPVNVF